MDLSNKIKKIREDNHLTQIEFAEKLNVTNSVVSRWENGKSTPDIETLNLIANTFNVDVKDIFDNVEVNNKKKNVYKRNLIKVIISLVTISIVPLLGLLMYYFDILSREIHVIEETPGHVIRTNYDYITEMTVLLILIIVFFLFATILYFISLSDYFLAKKKLEDKQVKVLKNMHIITGSLYVPFVIITAIFFALTLLVE